MSHDYFFSSIKHRTDEEVAIYLSMIEKLEESMNVTAPLHAMIMYPNSHTREIKVSLMEFHLYYHDYIKIGMKSYYFVKYLS